MPELETTLTADNFNEEVLKFSGVFLVDFWAPWCGPCRIMGPQVSALAEKYKDNPKVRVGKLNVDEANALANQFQVLSIPTLIVFVGGKVNRTLIGLRAPGELEKMMEEALSSL